VSLSGRPSALLRSAPLRTGRAAFTASGSSKPIGVACGQKCRVTAVAAGGVPAVAVGVCETVFGFVRRAVAPRGDVNDRLAGGGLPLLPLAWGLWRVLCGQEPGPAERAASVLGLIEAPAGSADRWGWRLCSPFGPVVGEGGVVRGGRALDHLVSDDPHPG
jgi:hypothetical protein